MPHNKVHESDRFIGEEQMATSTLRVLVVMVQQ
jgi:hypothetical protein